jgi:hypothetical protein
VPSDVILKYVWVALIGETTTPLVPLIIIWLLLTIEGYELGIILDNAVVSVLNVLLVIV